MKGGGGTEIKYQIIGISINENLTFIKLGLTYVYMYVCMYVHTDEKNEMLKLLPASKQTWCHVLARWCSDTLVLSTWLRKSNDINKIVQWHRKSHSLKY